MPNNNTAYWKFNVKNVFDNASLSSYALEQTPLRFVPTKYKEALYSDYYILWDFGDGSSVVNSLSSEHYYYYPGQYKVTMNVMLSTGVAAIDSYAQTITIKDFIPNTNAFKTLSSTTSINLTAGIFSPELTIERWNSLQSFTEDGYSFFLNASGSNSLYYDTTKLDSEPFSYLLPTHRFIKREPVGDIFSDEVINKIDTIDKKLYGRLKESSLVEPTSAEDPKSFFVGTSGYNNFYYVDDTIKTNKSYIFATLDTARFPDNYTKYNNFTVNEKLPIKNNSSTYYEISTVQYKQPDKFTITSNGLDGEGFLLTTFQIGKTKFKNSPINFVAKLKYNNGYDCKPRENKNLSFVGTNDDLYARLNQVAMEVIDSNGKSIGFNLSSYLVQDTSYYSDDSYGYLKGSVTFPQDFSYTGNLSAIDSGPIAFRIYGQLAVKDNALSGKWVEGTSDFFRVHDNTGASKVAKINENFDYPEVLQSYALQPTINQSPDLFEQFFGTVFGVLSSDPNSIGKKLYEKTSNFVENTSNIDTCNVQNLFGLASRNNVQINDFASANLLVNYPAEISRLVNIFSIKKSILFGRRLQYRTNYLNRYNLDEVAIDKNTAINNYITGKLGGNNLGEELNAKTSTINKKDNYIVAREIFSGVFTTLQTNIDAESSDTYPLSNYSDSWGWGLSLPPGTTYDNLSSYYRFFKFNDVVPGRYVNNLINWEDEYQTTIDIQGNAPLSSTYTPAYLSSFENTPLSLWDTKDGIVEQNLTYQMLKGYRLLSATN
tara:strand:- start:77 stop:2383 length:2307 start_codon:yes stop_codon:yes gene_type:complete